METSELSAETAGALASLVVIGEKSGDKVVGLSGVRRTRELAYVFIDGGIAANTLRELERLRRSGTEVYRVASLEPMTRALGREDALVVGIKRGGLAQGIAGRLADRPEGESGCVQDESTS